MDSASRPDPLEGLSVSSHRVERVLVRVREASHTFSAWALEVVTAEGPGRIVRVEPSESATHWRGDGVFLGWSEERLAAAWAALRAAGPAPEPTPDFQQLG
jgi:hypothetical protein